MDYSTASAADPVHVDRKLLYTSLEERIKYLHNFLDFNSSDIEALLSGNKYIKQLIPAVVNLVYKKLLRYDITSRAFHTRTTVDETEPEEDYLHEETPKIKRRKMFLRWYLTRLCQDPTTMDFWRYLNKVGLMHSGQARRTPLNIEYIHLGACLGYIQDIWIEAMMSHPHLSLRRKIALVRAVNKILWIQNDLFARYHSSDGEEFADEMSDYESYTQDQEGYLGSKRILGSSSGSSTEDDRSSISSGVAPSIAPSMAPSIDSLAPSTTSKVSACPFAEMSKSSNSTTETKIWAN
ncbi:hypothetical protein N7491_006951 [Penicillium cf. griseofulvum]|uniref:Globin-sensor domain-containing protein n=1 Tax=Penicillium cf. griseofulvum TaxID=2972120 RepID=A0A9W9IVT7_9EURO|nr:hypothetical protein N7472_010018 [Penicillium cf. griseofulvum]KAJ5429935.1 hypothetical protein N7491_006951 [Penicillium cf. griseofulvum]KAJ5436291.1 hypothetical protein N7445_007176 [Penicillium cf. griseofulvum]